MKFKCISGISEFKVLDNILHTVMAECRVIKTEKELEGRVTRFCTNTTRKDLVEFVQKLVTLSTQRHEIRLENLLRRPQSPHEEAQTWHDCK